MIHKSGYIQYGFEKETGDYFAFVASGGRITVNAVSKKSQEDVLLQLATQMANKLMNLHKVLTAVEVISAD